MRGKIIISLAFVCALASAAQAGELVTLRNGYEMRCDHHAEIEGRVRLYLSAGQDNFIDFVPQQIAGMQPVADPPPPIAAEPAAAEPGKDLSTTSTVPLLEAKLSPADLREMLAKAGGEHNVDVDLLASLVKAESGGNVRAVSRAGARGLMQLMPGTASELGVQDSFKPDQNVRGGSAYLDALLTRYHDKLALALAAYNAGPAAVDKYHGIPPYSETRAYVARVIHEFNRRVLAREALAKQTVASATTPPGHGTR
ncbi:MAG: lytic transglycosylase domain-containing protein [Terracidiphilus sp.]